MTLEQVRKIKGNLVETVRRRLGEGPGGTIALGIARRGEGPNDYVLAVRIQNRKFRKSPELSKIKDMAGSDVEIEYIGAVVASHVGRVPLNRRLRRLKIGAFLGYQSDEGGTLACFVNDAANNIYILSNNHVIADENFAPLGSEIYRPPILAGGSFLTDGVATLSNFITLVPISAAGAAAPNFADAAIALVDNGVKYDTQAVGKLGNLTGCAGASIGAPVAKYSAFSGETRGTVTATTFDNFVATYVPLGDVAFQNLVEITGHQRRPFSRPGDSGSLVVDTSNAPNLTGVAMILGIGAPGRGGTVRTYACPLPTALSALKVSIYSVP